VSAASYLEVPKLAGSSEASSALEDRLRHDDWPAVREASLGALGSLRRDAKFAEDAERAIIRALAKDREVTVRSRAARTLAELPTEDTLAALRRSLAKDESAAVRAEAARSLGLLCDQASLSELTSAARGITRGARDEADVRLALNAVTALSRLGPPDLNARIQPLRADSVPGPLRGRIDAAVEAGSGGCAAARKR
jgi:HEAT repeat protein